MKVIYFILFSSILLGQAKKIASTLPTCQTNVPSVVLWTGSKYVCGPLGANLTLGNLNGFTDLNASGGGTVGPAGPIGPTGATGVQGLPGTNGVNGVNGLPGPIGATGPMGPQGATGATGPAGTNGTGTGGSGLYQQVITDLLPTILGTSVTINPGIASCTNQIASIIASSVNFAGATGIGNFIIFTDQYCNLTAFYDNTITGTVSGTGNLSPFAITPSVQFPIKSNPVAMASFNNGVIAPISNIKFDQRAPRVFMPVAGIGINIPESNAGPVQILTDGAVVPYLGAENSWTGLQDFSAASVSLPTTSLDVTAPVVAPTAGTKFYTLNGKLCAMSSAGVQTCTQ